MTPPPAPQSPARPKAHSQQQLPVHHHPALTSASVGDQLLPQKSGGALESVRVDIPALLVEQGWGGAVVGEGARAGVSLNMLGILKVTGGGTEF
jgi:hypothetical protein